MNAADSETSCCRPPSRRDVRRKLEQGHVAQPGSSSSRTAASARSAPPAAPASSRPRAANGSVRQFLCYDYVRCGRGGVLVDGSGAAARIASTPTARRPETRIHAMFIANGDLAVNNDDRRGRVPDPRPDRARRPATPIRGGPANIHTTLHIQALHDQRVARYSRGRLGLRRHAPDARLLQDVARGGATPEQERRVRLVLYARSRRRSEAWARPAVLDSRHSSRTIGVASSLRTRPRRSSKTARSSGCARSPWAHHVPESFHLQQPGTRQHRPPRRGTKPRAVDEVQGRRSPGAAPVAPRSGVQASTTSACRRPARSSSP